MEVKDFIAEYNKNGTKNLVYTKAEVSKPGALDSKEIANFFVEKVGGADSFAKHYSQWGREYNETQKQISGIQDGYSSKDVMKDAAQKLRNLAASGSIYNYVNTTLGGKGTPNFAESLNKQINALEERSEFYSQWATEEEYKEALKAQEDYEKSLNLNTEAAERDIGYYEKELNAINTVEAEIRKLQSEQQTLKLAKAKGSKDASAKLEENQKRLATLNESLEKAWGTYGSKEKLESFISQKKAYTTQAKRLQAGVALTNEALNAEDFGKYNAPNAEIANEDLTYKYINDVDGYRQEITSWYANNSGYTSDTGITYPNVKPKFLELNFEHMNDEEISIYNYYYSKFGAEKANEYLDLLQETLNTRSASKIREDYDTDLKRMLFAVAAGLDQFESGVENLFNFSDDYIVSSDTQIASGMIREDLKDSGAKLPDWMGGGSIGQAGYDLITTTTNMAPSILTSAVVGMVNPVAGQIVGAGLMGASASGNAYAEALSLGYDKTQARTYSVLVGASEAGLQYLLGGIGAMGGALTGKASTKIATKLASNVDKAFGKMLVSGGTKLVGNMVSEFGEEYLQEVLTPVFKNIALKTEEDVKLVSPEAFYAGFLGALSAGVLESGGTVAGEVGTYNSGKSVMEKGKTNDLVNLGKSFSTDTIAYQIASKIDGNTDAYTLGQLLNEAGAGSLTESNMAEIQKSLERKGVTPQDAQTIAKWLNKAVEGRYFTNSQIEALSQNEVISATFRDVILNQKSTVNQRVQRYQDILESLEQENANSTEATATPANVDATVGAVNDIVSGTATEDVSNAYTPTSKVDENGRPITAVIDGVKVDLKTKQPVLNEPNLTDTSGPNTYLAEDADKQPFLHNDEHTRVENIAEKLGMELRWSSKIGQEGKYVGGVIYLDPHCADPLLQVYKHEFTHWLENSRWYKSFVAYLKSTQVYKTWIEEYHGGEEAYSAEIKKDYEDAGLKYDVTHEIVANFVAERVLGGIGGFEYDANGRLVNRDPIVEEALTEFAETHKHWYDAILTHIKDIIATIKNLYYKVTGKDATQQPQSEELKEIYRRLVQLKDTVNTKKAAQSETIEFSLMNSDSFQNNVDNILNMPDELAKQNAEEGNFVRILSDAPSVILQNVKDAENHEVIISFYSLYLAVRKSGVLEGHYHNLGDMIKQLPEYISNPHAIVRMADGRLNLFTQIKTKRGDNGILSIELNTVKDINSKYDKYNLVITVYSANDNHTKNRIEQSGVKVEYEKEDLAQVNPQLYKWLAIINAKSSTPIIPNPSQNVNKNSSANTDNSDTQNSITIDAEYMQAVEKGDEETAQRLVNEAAERAMSDSKARDMDGKLDVVYHGTSAEEEFYVFDKTRQGQTDSSTFGKGYYFTADYEYAEMFSEENPNNKPRSFFLNITNPFKISDVSAPASEIANKLIDLGISVDFDYRGLEAHEFANKFGNKRFSDTLQELGYDGVIVNDGFEYVVFDQNKMKSAEAITYDDNGDVIPLEQRFDYDSNDVRYYVSPSKNNGLLELYKEGKLTREQYQAEVAARLYGDKRQSAVGETRDQNGLDSNVETLENESLIEDPTTGPEPEGAEITVAYMNGRVAPTGIQKAIESIADKLGVKLEFAEFYNADGSKAEHINGYETDDGRVVVNVFSKRQVSFIFKHELTHTLKYSKGYKLFKELVLSSTAFKEWATKKAGVSSGAEATAILAQRAVESRTGLTIKGVDNATVNESDIDGRDEVLGDFIAENCFGMDDESAIKALRALVTANRNVFVRLADKVSQLLDKLRGTQYDMSLRQIERRFRRVLNEKDNMNSGKSGVSLSTEPSGPNKNFVEDKYFARQIDKWSSLKDGSYVTVGNIKQKSPLNMVGIPSGKLYFDVTKIKTELEKHNDHLTPSVLKEIPKLLAEPIVITEYKPGESKNTVSVYGNFYYNDVPVVVGIVVTLGRGNNVITKIRTVHARGDITKQINDLSVLYLNENKKETDRWFQAQGHRVPMGGTKYGFIRSISQLAHNSQDEKTNNTKINLSVESTTESDLSADEIREQLKNGEITIDEAMDAMQNLYGAIPKGELASRDIDVPMQTSDGKYTRRFARTVLESEHLTDEQVSDVSEDLINEVLSYVPVGNEQAVKAADAAIQNGTAEEEWKKVVYGGSDWVSKEKIVIGERLLIQAAKDGDKARVCQLVAEIAEVGTRAGQVVQALSVLKRLNGAGQLMYVKRVVDRVNENLKKRFGTDKSTGQPKKQLKINDTLAVQLVNAKGEAEVDTATKELMKDLGEQMPSTFIDKWNAWRYLSMLGNLRTHIRNLAGNAVFIPAIKCKNILAKAIEYVLPVEQRTKSVVVKKEYRDFAAKNFDAVYDILTGNGKQNPSDAIRDNAKVFKTRWLENLRKLNFNALELEDAMFLKLHYVSALAGYLQAQKVDLSNIDDATLQKAQLYAIEEAQKATYRDASAVASTLSKLSKQNMMANALVEGVLPFKKTPVNILKRSVEYSPIGLMKAVTFNVYALKKGDITASQFVDALAGGLTGTGISILGFFLASLGMLRGPLGWGDKEDEFEELYGEQGYSIVIGDMSFTIDWMAPSCVPLFIGSELYNMLDAENTNIFDVSVDAMANLIGPVFEMSMLDGINDTIKSVRFSDNPTAALIPEMLSSYAGQAIPTMSGQIARTIDDTRRTTYYDATSGVPKTVQKAWQRLANKLPGISYFSPEYIDAFGQTERKETAYDWIEAAAENFILPGYIGHTDKDSVYHGLKVVESEEALPSKIKDNFINVRTVDENNKKSTEKRYLTADEYEKYQTQYGKMSKQYLFDLIENPKYDSVDDAVKTKAIKILYEYSKEVAKKSVFDEHVYSAKKYARWQQCEEVGVSIADLALVEALFLDEKDNEENKKSDKVIYQEIAQEFVDDKNEQRLLVQINNAKSRDNADTIINRIIENYNN